MAHPKVTKMVHGVRWHLEDSHLPLVNARSLVTHLKNTEDKRATFNKAKGGYEVWWATK